MGRLLEQGQRRRPGVVGRDQERGARPRREGAQAVGAEPGGGVVELGRERSRRRPGARRRGPGRSRRGALPRARADRARRGRRATSPSASSGRPSCAVSAGPGPAGDRDRAASPASYAARAPARRHRATCAHLGELVVALAREPAVGTDEARARSPSSCSTVSQSPSAAISCSSWIRVTPANMKVAGPRRRPARQGLGPAPASGSGRRARRRGGSPCSRGRRTRARRPVRRARAASLRRARRSRRRFGPGGPRPCRSAPGRSSRSAGSSKSRAHCSTVRGGGGGRLGSPVTSMSTAPFT